MRWTLKILSNLLEIITCLEFKIWGVQNWGQNLKKNLGAQNPNSESPRSIQSDGSNTPLIKELVFECKLEEYPGKVKKSRIIDRKNMRESSDPTSWTKSLSDSKIFRSSMSITIFEFFPFHLSPLCVENHNSFLYILTGEHRQCVSGENREDLSDGAVRLSAAGVSPASPGLGLHVDVASLQPHWPPPLDLRSVVLRASSAPSSAHRLPSGRIRAHPRKAARSRRGDGHRFGLGSWEEWLLFSWRNHQYRHQGGGKKL